MRWLGQIYPIVLMVLGAFFIIEDMFADTPYVGTRSLAGAILLASVMIASRRGLTPEKE